MERIILTKVTLELSISMPTSLMEPCSGELIWVEIFAVVRIILSLWYMILTGTAMQKWLSKLQMELQIIMEM